MSTGSYDVVEGIATAEEYVHIRAVRDLGDRSLVAARRGPEGTWFGVIARHDGETIGMGRVLADGDAKRLHSRHGFGETAPASVGMALEL